eukprot:8436783-Pyramimonas_sp.AAC.1
MRNGSNISWSCSVHIVSDSTIAFKDAPRKLKNSLLPEYNLRKSVFGSARHAMSGAQISNIRDASSKLQWDQTGYYIKGTQSPIRFTFWNFNDIVDNASQLNGVGSGPKRQANPLAFAGSLRFMINDAVTLIDDAMRRSSEGAVDIMFGGGHKCWRNDDGGVDPMWDDAATLVRARMNRRIEHFKAIG